MEVILSLNGFTKTMAFPEVRQSVRTRIYKPLSARHFTPGVSVDDTLECIDLYFEHDHDNVYCADVFEIVNKMRTDSLRDKFVNRLLHRISGLEREIRRLKSGR